MKILKFMKIYFRQQCFIEFWFSSSNQLQKMFKIPKCKVLSLLAKFYKTKTPVNYERKISKKNDQINFMLCADVSASVPR